MDTTDMNISITILKPYCAKGYTFLFLAMHTELRFFIISQYSTYLNSSATPKGWHFSINIAESVEELVKIVGVLFYLRMRMPALHYDNTVNHELLFNCNNNLY